MLTLRIPTVCCPFLWPTACSAFAIWAPSISGDVLRWREEAAAGRRVSPRIVTAGRVIDGDPPANRAYSVVVKNAVEARRAVQDLKAQKVDLLKGIRQAFA